jgi:Fic family protein
MEPSQFSSDAPGSLHHDPAGYWTFHPYPLPPLFRWSDRLVAALSAADRAVARWEALAAGAPPGFGGLIARIEAAASCRLSGVETDLAGMFEYEAAYRSEDDPPEGPADACAYAEALEAACRRDGGGGLEPEEIAAIHGQLFPRTYEDDRPVGEVRRGQTWIGTDEAGPSGAVFVPPPPEVMDESLESLAVYIREDRSDPPLVRLALVHYQFEVIHPFYDANGRLGRLINVLLPCRWGLLSGPVLAPSSYLLRHAGAYPDLLSRLSRENEVEGWLVFFLDGLAQSAAAAEGVLDALGSMRAEYLERIAAERTADRLEQVINLALVRPYLNVGQVEAALPEANFKSAARYVDRLEALGILEEITGQNRHRVYRAREWVARIS